MRLFDDRLWDNSDPLYAPGLQWSKPNHARWKAPKRYVDAGYPIKGQKLDGHKGDGQDVYRANQCRELTRAMMRWWEGKEQKLKPNTWIWLIERYRTDSYSPYQRVAHSTKEQYDHFLNRLDGVIGHRQIGDTNFQMIMEIKQGMEAKGRSVDAINKFFNIMRRVSRYGSVLEVAEAQKVATILSNLTFERAPARTIAPTREQEQLCIKEAERRGHVAFATGLIMQFELSLRAMDIRGTWEPAPDAEGGVTRNGKVWVKGLTWDMIDRNTTTLTKVISKTRRSNPEPYVFDLTLVPQIRDRLIKLGHMNGRVGPIILSEKTGLPYTRYGWAQAFRKIRAHLIEQGHDIPSDLCAMDMRAGGLSEARSRGADPYQLRDAGQHASLDMNSRYIRDRSTAANKVLQLRKGK